MRVLSATPTYYVGSGVPFKQSYVSAAQQLFQREVGKPRFAVYGPADHPREQLFSQSEPGSFVMVSFLSGFAIGLIVGVFVGLVVPVLIDEFRPRF